MVSALGLTRSKGRVSHAGKVSTASSPRNAVRSWANRSASEAVGVTMTTGWRADSCVSPAATKAQAASGMATTALDRPARPTRVSSPRSSLGSELSGAGAGSSGWGSLTGSG